MYTKFKLSDVQIGEIKIGDIEVEAKYTTMEISSMYDLSKQALKEIPGMLEDLKAGALKFIEIDKEIEELARKDFEEEMELKKQAVLDFNAKMRKVMEDEKSFSRSEDDSIDE